MTEEARSETEVETGSEVPVKHDFPKPPPSVIGEIVKKVVDKKGLPEAVDMAKEGVDPGDLVGSIDEAKGIPAGESQGDIPIATLKRARTLEDLADEAIAHPLKGLSVAVGRVRRNTTVRGANDIANKAAGVETIVRGLRKR
ncbi:hypothetical protein A2165_04075 [Candidatus Curtissbacteria bacterium RBG_13_40_7]|uniref:Uncharacterized protein n=1 Tax=Candidatus Curtissbacteria bacterium RBG_13_40_7 TaxID=1797706 RepID=A0A1F5FZG7_9BACT|nr:MAG: hypothetical protein A2165_04075 [Candidatus Curtissbacteria bacterium RBG_13_40_7]